MNTAILLFRQNIAAIRNLGAIYSWLKSNAPNLQTADILRAQIANVSSALDKFIHDVVRIGSIEIIIGERKQPENSAVLEKFAATQYKLFAVKAQEFLNQIIASPSEATDIEQDWQAFKSEQASQMEQAFYERMQADSYLKPSNLAETLKQIGVKDLWARVERKLENKGIVLANLPFLNLVADQSKLKDAGKKVEASLNAIYKSRNLIVHEFDLNYATSRRNPIYQVDVNPIIDFIENTCEAIFEIVEEDR